MSVPADSRVTPPTGLAVILCGFTREYVSEFTHASVVRPQGANRAPYLPALASTRCQSGSFMRPRIRALPLLSTETNNALA